MLVNTFRCVRFLLLLLLPPLLTSVSAAPVTPVSSGKPSGKTCINATIPITISARNALFNTAIPSSDTDVVNLISNLTRPGGNFSAQILAGYATVAGTYRISTQYCMPAGKPQPRPTIQVLTHGIGFDKTYWDLAFGNYKYSYVDYATSNGCVSLYTALSNSSLF